eukprot:gene27670-33419_t
MEHRWDSKDLFEVLLETAVSKIYSLEDVVFMAYEMGKEHGNVVKNKLADPDKERALSAINPTPSNKPYGHVNRTESSSSRSSKPNSPHILKPPAQQSSGSNPSQQTVPNGNLYEYKTYIGVDFVGHSTNGTHELLSLPYQSTLSLPLLERTLPLGTYYSSEEAAFAHDRALIRAIGPAQCTDSMLNNPIAFYAKDPLELFEQFDPVLKRGLFGTKWTGPKDVDFSSLIVQAPMKRPRL